MSIMLIMLTEGMQGIGEVRKVAITKKWMVRLLSIWLLIMLIELSEASMNSQNSWQITTLISLEFVKLS